MGKLFWMFIFSTKRWRFHRLIKANTYSNIHCLHFVCKYTFTNQSTVYTQILIACKTLVSCGQTLIIVICSAYQSLFWQLTIKFICINYLHLQIFQIIEIKRRIEMCLNLLSHSSQCRSAECTYINVSVNISCTTSTSMVTIQLFAELHFAVQTPISMDNLVESHSQERSKVGASVCVYNSTGAWFLEAST